MTAFDRAQVTQAIRAAWEGPQVTEKRGVVDIPPVREGGVTAALIDLAAQIADEYYRRPLEFRSRRAHERVRPEADDG